MPSACCVTGRPVIVLLCVAALAGCATRRAPDLAGRFIAHGKPEERSGAQDQAPQESREASIARLRVLSQEMRPGPTSGASPMVERWDSGLAAARVALARQASAETHRAVAEAYFRLGVLDLAYDHFHLALTYDRTDAASYDRLARIWRGWGFPNLGLSDASRAVHFAPESAAAHNTLGTILQALGRMQEARSAYQRAAALDPKAAYALNNLCYISFLSGRMSEAATDCRSALRVQPALASAHNNLAMVHASTGDRASAEREFALAAGPSIARYNMGIVDLAGRQYRQAAEAFEAAYRLNPALDEARQRARQARALADQLDDGESDHDRR